MTHLDESPLAVFLLDLGPDYMKDWSGTPSELLNELTMLAGKRRNHPLAQIAGAALHRAARLPRSSASMAYSSISSGPTTVGSCHSNGFEPCPAMTRHATDATCHKSNEIKRLSHVASPTSSA